MFPRWHSTARILRGADNVLDIISAPLTGNNKQDILGYCKKLVVGLGEEEKSAETRAKCQLTLLQIFAKVEQVEGRYLPDLAGALNLPASLINQVQIHPPLELLIQLLEEHMSQQTLALFQIRNFLNKTKSFFAEDSEPYNRLAQLHKATFDNADPRVFKSYKRSAARVRARESEQSAQANKKLAP